MQHSAQRAGAKTVWVGFSSLRELKDHLSNHVDHGVDLILELERVARHPIRRAHGFNEFRLKTVHQAPRRLKVTHLRSPSPDFLEQDKCQVKQRPMRPVAEIDHIN
jgi:hypothetical protein